MSADEPAPAVDAEQDGGGRIAGGCVLAIGLTAAGGVAVAFPDAAYFVTGLLAATAVRKGRAIAVRFRSRDEQSDAEPVDIVAALQALAADGQHVRLTQLREAAKLPDTKAVRALLDEAGIRIRDGVRAAGKNGPGVHHDDVPPLLGMEKGTPSGRCLCSSNDNTNANNAALSDPREGLHVEAIGQAGAVVRVESERRAYTV
ncbi:hypothetical protein [Streptomyces sp. A1136]|uniref:hypothetical protein n=1 Tax=Streptomyces sp. A1136 TaxID=2563102 RepID=UPI00109EC3A6|nr:hypothetical protein [Streptomyces sp. A1136]THA56116.1 hypothetical protein E6R62_12280 [Streptomyces sp. A1136]